MSAQGSRRLPPFGFLRLTGFWRAIRQSSQQYVPRALELAVDIVDAAMAATHSAAGDAKAPKVIAAVLVVAVSPTVRRPCGQVKSERGLKVNTIWPTSYIYRYIRFLS